MQVGVIRKGMIRVPSQHFVSHHGFLQPLASTTTMSKYGLNLQCHPRNKALSVANSQWTQFGDFKKEFSQVEMVRQELEHAEHVSLHLTGKIDKGVLQ